MPLLPGSATPQGTRRFQQRSMERHHLPSAHFREAPGGLTLSSIGLGTYLGRPDPATDLAVEEATTLSIESGRINLLDTAINYRYQRAERSLGRALARLFGSGRARREEIFVATKAGYLAPDGESSITPDVWVSRELVAKGVLRPEDIVDGSHAMSPSYLSDQLSRSRANLGLETIDLFYLHNAADAQLASVGAEEFFARLELAFRLLEERRRSGEIRAYGLASWDALRSAPDDPGHLCLEETLRLARKVGGEEHGFRFVQFPFNLAMPEAARLANQRVAGSRRTLFEAAKILGIGCMTSVPLLQGQLARSGSAYAGLSLAASALQWARSAPGNVAALIGQKSPAHLAENLALADLPPWDARTFEERAGI